MNPPSPELTLADLPRVLVGKVLSVEGSGKFSERLRELGFCLGTEVRFERQAPWGGPIIVSLRGYRLCLRLSEAKLIRIEGMAGLGGIG
ncbi:MAG: FeoA family protein [Planctomycetota bacterium]|nr:FeoA family protein [Planctomycetota bacterium]